MIFFLNTSFRNIRGKGSGRFALNQKFQNFLRLEVERVVNGAKILLENIITPKIIKISKLKKYREEVQTEQKCPVSTLILVKFVHSLRGWMSSFRKRSVKGKTELQFKV